MRACSQCLVLHLKEANRRMMISMEVHQGDVKVAVNLQVSACWTGRLPCTSNLVAGRGTLYR